MIGSGVAKTLLSGAAGLVAAASDAAGHAAWWVSYQVRGTTHDDDHPVPDPDPAEEGS